MMDTTAINWGLTKITQGIQAAMPTLQQVGEKFVKYTVFKEIAIFSELAAVLLIGIIMVFIANICERTYCKNNNCSYLNEPRIANIFVIAGFSLTVIGFIGVALQFNNVFMAITNPEMYTIMSLIQPNN